MAHKTRHSIGYNKAIEMYESKWWEGCDYRTIANFQMSIAELCMPFHLFHEAMEKTLNRPIFTHEFGFGYEGLLAELLGERNSPTFDEVLEMIPKEKRLVFLIEKPSNGDSIDKPQP